MQTRLLKEWRTLRELNGGSFFYSTFPGDLTIPQQRTRNVDVTSIDVTPTVANAVLKDSHYTSHETKGNKSRLKRPATWQRDSRFGRDPMVTNLG